MMRFQIAAGIVAATLCGAAGAAEAVTAPVVTPTIDVATAPNTVEDKESALAKAKQEAKAKQAEVAKLKAEVTAEKKKAAVEAKLMKKPGATAAPKPTPTVVAAPVISQADIQSITTSVVSAMAAKAKVEAPPAFPDNQALFVNLKLDDCNQFLPQVASADDLKIKVDSLIAANAKVSNMQIALDPAAAGKAKAAAEASLANAKLEQMAAEVAVRESYLSQFKTPASALNAIPPGADREAALRAVLPSVQADMRKLLATWERDDDFPSLIKHPKKLFKQTDKKTRETLDRRMHILSCAQRLYQIADDAKDASKTLTPGAIQNNQTAEEIKEDYIKVAHRDVYDRAQLSVFVGPSFTLKPDGGFQSGVETTVLFDGGAGSLFNIGRTVTDFSYVSRAAQGQGQSTGETIANQFSGDKGYFRLNTGTSFNINDRYSFLATAGLSAVPRDNQSITEGLRQRYSATILGRTFLSDGVYSRIGAGFAYDKSWRYFEGVATNPANQRESYTRFIANIEVLTPTVAAASVHASGALRLRVDTPLNGKGPSEVRLSALLYVNFNDFFSALNPLAKVKP